MSDDATLPSDAVPTKPKRHVLTLEERRRGGRARTPKKRAAVRMNAYRHGRDAGSVTPQEAIESRLRRIDPDLPELVATVVEELAGDRVDAATKLLARSMLEHEILRQKIVEKISGALTVEDVLLDKDGQPYGHRLKAHPLLEHLQKLQRSILDSAEALQVTRKARGEGAKNAAMTAVLERAAMLRSADKSRMLPPAPDPIDGD